MTSVSSAHSDNFFNDLSQSVPPQRSTSSESSTMRESASMGENEGQPRAKRIACVLCRKRKLRCDGARPKCGTCSRLNHECGYDEVRKKSGPKRGYVKLLEARLQQVETLLKTQDSAPGSSKSMAIDPSEKSQSSPGDHEHPPTSEADGFVMTKLVDPSAIKRPNPEQYSWEMIGLGLEEPLPPQDAINELHQLFFSKVHPYGPMIHKPRYLAAMNLAPHMRPPVCLRYAMWALAACVNDKFANFAPEFYRRARKYLDIDEMKGNGEAIITLAHCQTWVLISWYEFKHMFFPRAWLSTGRASSLATMMGLNRLDGAVLDVKQCLPPPKDWTEREERRRTFWFAFCSDRYASIGTGWPHRLDESDIMTLLPTSDDAFEKSRPTTAPSLEQAFQNSAATDVSAVSGVILISCILGRNLTHLHRPTPHDNEEDLNGTFWQRHRELEDLLDNIALALPDHLRIPSGLPDSNVIFMNMLLHTSIICLHQAAIFKADRNKLPANIIHESRARCLTGAGEITRIMKMMSHIDLATLNPFISFCLYVAARVFVQYLKWRPKDQGIVSSLQFLGSAMHALSRRNPLTESFMAQLEVDLEGTGINLGTRPSMWAQTGVCRDKNEPNMQGVIPEYEKRTSVPPEIPVNTDGVKCTPIFEIRDSQSAPGQSNNNNVFHKQQPMSSNSFYHQAGNAQINIIDPFNSQGQMNTDSFQLPSRSKDSPFSNNLFVEDLNGTSEMNYSASSKSRSNSYKDTSSHTSFTPPSINDATSPSSNTLAPQNSNNSSSHSPSSSAPTPGMPAADVMYFEVPGNAYQTFQPQLFAPFGDMTTSAGAMAGLTGSSWEMGGVDNNSNTGSTGLTPMASGDNWNEFMGGN